TARAARPGAWPTRPRARPVAWAWAGARRRAPTPAGRPRSRRRAPASEPRRSRIRQNAGCRTSLLGERLEKREPPATPAGGSLLQASLPRITSGTPAPSWAGLNSEPANPAGAGIQTGRAREHAGALRR